MFSPRLHSAAVPQHCNTNATDFSALLLASSANFPALLAPVSFGGIIRWLSQARRVAKSIRAKGSCCSTKHIWRLSMAHRKNSKDDNTSNNTHNFGLHHFSYILQGKMIYSSHSKNTKLMNPNAFTAPVPLVAGFAARLTRQHVTTLQYAMFCSSQCYTCRGQRNILRASLQQVYSNFNADLKNGYLSST